MKSTNQLNKTNFTSQAMESKLLMGGGNIVDHTNEQQRALEQRRKEIAEQKVSLFKLTVAVIIDNFDHFYIKKKQLKN